MTIQEINFILETLDDLQGAKSGPGDGPRPMADRLPNGGGDEQLEAVRAATTPARHPGLFEGRPQMTTFRDPSGNPVHVAKSAALHSWSKAALRKLATPGWSIATK